MAADDDLIEVRVYLPRFVINVLDAVHHTTGDGRKDVIQKLTLEWAEREYHKASVILKLAGGNPGSMANKRRASD